MSVAYFKGSRGFKPPKPRPVLRQPKSNYSVITSSPASSPVSIPKPRPVLRQRPPGQMLNRTGTTKTRPILKNTTRQRFNRFASRNLGRVQSYAKKKGFGSIAKGIGKASSFFKPIRMSRYRGNMADFSAYKKYKKRRRREETWGKNRGRITVLGLRTPSRRQLLRRLPAAIAIGGGVGLASHYGKKAIANSKYGGKL